jgi:hypothetical protein
VVSRDNAKLRRAGQGNSAGFDGKACCWVGLLPLEQQYLAQIEAVPPAEDRTVLGTVRTNESRTQQAFVVMMG